jgi:hypothetical protein
MGLQIGWAQADLTPDQAVGITGQFHDRVSEGVENPLTATAMVLEGSEDHVVFVSCDLVYASHELLDGIRSELTGRARGLDPRKVVLHATHTHTGPNTRLPDSPWRFPESATYLKLPVMAPSKYIALAAERISQAIVQAWDSRSAGRIAFGLGHAVVGHNRRWVDTAGTSTMYGDLDTPEFSHIEGSEDHTVGVIACKDAQGQLTGLVVNVPCPSQVTESQYLLSADYWHETRQELRRRLGEDLFVLAQCSAAGDQSPHPLREKRARNRMLELAGRTEREEIGQCIADAVERVLAILGDREDAAAPLRHHVEDLELPLLRITKEQARTAGEEAEEWRQKYEQEAERLKADPSLRDRPRWYTELSRARNRMQWSANVADRYEWQEQQTGYACEVHVIRLGDVAFATNPFEYYLDFGILIKARSPAVQTFLVQLAGPGGYVPSLRSTLGGGYGSVPASGMVGPEGGRVLAERTIECIREMWD